MPRQETVIAGEEFQRFKVSIGTARADGDVENINAAILVGGVVLGGEIVWIAEHLHGLARADPQRSKHIDDRGPLDELNRARGVFRSAGKRQIPSSIHHRCGKTDAAAGGLQKASTIHFFARFRTMPFHTGASPNQDCIIS